MTCRTAIRHDLESEQRDETLEQKLKIYSDQIRTCELGHKSKACKQHTNLKESTQFKESRSEVKCHIGRGPEPRWASNNLARTDIEDNNRSRNDYILGQNSTLEAINRPCRKEHKEAMPCNWLNLGRTPRLWPSLRARPLGFIVILDFNFIFQHFQHFCAPMDQKALSTHKPKWNRIRLSVGAPRIRP